jgi:hypothetical protein
MPRYFTHYWKNETCRDHEPDSGEPLDYIAGNLFRERGVNESDVIYVVTVKRGCLFLIGRLTVGQICGPAEAARILGTDDLWPAKEHIIAASATPMRFDIEVPSEHIEKLLFVASPHSKPPRFTKPAYLDKQTLRSVRELEPASATALDELLPPDTSIPRTTEVA